MTAERQHLVRTEAVQDDAVGPRRVGAVGHVDVERHIHVIGSLRGDFQSLAHRLEHPRRRIELAV